MPTAAKEATVAELKELVERSAIVIGAEYRGLSVRDMTALRRALRDAGVEARVVKNRLFQLAAKQAGLETAGGVVEGPSLVIFGFGDIIAPSKAVVEYARTARNTFAPKRAFVDGAVVDQAYIQELATLPSREELIGKLAGAFVQPVQNLAFLLNDTIQSFARLVDARADQLESGGEAA
ncbi:MAG TPA: 50S ribosomal protein L10 [Dehalococcoidia bacterium]|nr:50S ribosomal protein L10 [Dehalococcoidia bacterium]